MIYDFKVDKVPTPEQGYYPTIGKIYFRKDFTVDGHKIVQVKIERPQNPYWPECFTWVDGIPWPYRGSIIKGHQHFPDINRIKKFINQNLIENQVTNFNIIIHVRKYDVECEFSENTPWILADEIRKVVNKFYEK